MEVEERVAGVALALSVGNENTTIMTPSQETCAVRWATRICVLQFRYVERSNASDTVVEKKKTTIFTKFKITKLLKYKDNSKKRLTKTEIIGLETDLCPKRLHCACRFGQDFINSCCGYEGGTDMSGNRVSNAYLI